MRNNEIRSASAAHSNAKGAAGKKTNLVTVELPDEHGNLKLEKVNVYNNSLFGTIPISILLKRLLIGKNNLTGESSSSELRFFSSLTNYQYLELIEVTLNQLNGTLPASIGNFSISLQVFRAFECHVKGAIPDKNGNLNSLADLYLDGNQLTGKLRRLQRIYLEYNKLDGFIPAELCQLSNLGDLYISSSMGQFPRTWVNLNL
ncbi:LRR receptor-like serine/threonine-protein kinase FLS2 [Forsythia ovata]|uniref:LRR receptor-like serine/threonine-protein kinase FLS2 n=1 Tax=Forsythia ovata TaxID=205694 RepID=A0ABD1VN41_9LAMI